MDALEDTGAPWAAGEAEDDPEAGEAEGEAPGFGKGLNALDTWPAEGGVTQVVQRLRLAQLARRLWPQPANGRAKSANSAMRITKTQKYAPE